MRSVEEVLKACRRESDYPTQDYTARCLRFVRTMYDLPARYPSAASAWKNARKKHTSPPPAGVPIFWTGGKHGYGHIAISTGDGKCWSTDLKRRGHVDLIPVSQVHAKWGLHYEGWSEDLNTYQIYMPPPIHFFAQTFDTPTGHVLAHAKDLHELHAQLDILIKSNHHDLRVRIL